MKAYVINLDSAVKRWQHMEASFQQVGIDYERVPAVNGRELVLPIAEFDQGLYLRRHGKYPNLGQIGCYLSHVKALRRFLETGDEFAMICEDDVWLHPQLANILRSALEHRDCWDLVRLSGFHHSHPKPIRRLDQHHQLAVNMTRLCGTGAYLVHRNAAQKLIERLLPMSLPIDHALDREWEYGLKAVSIHPLPVDQQRIGFQSQLPAEQREKLPAWRRYWTVFPYRAWNETCRVSTRWAQIRRFGLSYTAN